MSSPGLKEWKDQLRKVATVLSLVWAAGCVGGFSNWLIGPIFQGLRILELSGVYLNPILDSFGLYKRLATGGLWGLIFLLTLPASFKLQGGSETWQFWLRAFLYGLVPALVQIFLILPHDGHGIGGVDYGYATPIFVIIFNTLGWSLPAYYWLYTIGPEDNDMGFGYETLAPA